PVNWLIRACQDRATIGESGKHLRDHVLAAPALYEVELRIRGRKAKTAAEDRARRQNRETRQAKVEVRAATVTLRPPHRPDRKLPAGKGDGGLVREPDPPGGGTAGRVDLGAASSHRTAELVRLIVAYY